MESLASNVWKRVVIRGRKRKRRRNLVDITILTWDEIYNTIDNFISLVVHKNRDEKIRGKHFSFLGWTKEEEKKRIIRSPIEIRAKRGRGKLGISAFVSRPREDRAAWRANDVSNGDIYVAILRPDQSVDRCTTLRIDGERTETKVFQSVRGEAVDKDRNSVLLVDGSVWERIRNPPLRCGSLDIYD